MAFLDDIDSMALTPAPDDQGSEEDPRFLIEEQLGEGGFGKVYLGEDTRLDRKVAIKVLNREISEVADSAGAAFDEARALAGIEHRNVVPVYDAGRTVKGEVFVVSKYIEGCSLDEALTEGLLTREEFIARVLEICGALEAVHEAGIIHRDIKPDNILLDLEKKAVLIDFGIAATLDGARWLRQAGTPKYMSPEQARGQDHLVDAQSDLYSLGAVLYRGLIGDTLREESSAGRTSESGARQMEVRLDNLDEQLPPDLAAICQKALAVPKSDRYKSAKAFGEDLRVALLGGKDEKREAIEEEAVVPRGLRAFGPEDAGFFLKLVPGRREPSTKLPVCIHQWKVWIEDRGLSGEKPFRVGLLYGPSGSGKSSLLKAGLLPQLDDSIIVVRFDASSGETEDHFKKVLCARFPHLDSYESLGWMLGTLRRGGLPTGTKLLIVIDQFEQWLHAHPDDISTAVLTKSLRQCDGHRIQALITLRDEFWRPVSRLMEELDAPMRQGENIALVEPFDQAHGRRVLESLGRGLGRLEGKLSRGQRSFMDQAIDLASDGRKVSPLRLSLLAQIFENRDWVPESLAGVNTSEDLGSVYLDQAFHDEKSPLRGREDSAKRFLALLLPDKRSVIRGSGVSAETLKEALQLDDNSFDELVHTLDAELRLITPMAAEKGRYYQLSHDYLVRAVRHWFADAQKKNFRGLALLRLEDQTEDWLVGDRKKLLPGFIEWIWFKILTPVAARSVEARQMMIAANRHFYRRLLLLSGCAVLVTLLVVVWADRNRAKDSVDQLMAARPAELGAALEKVRSFSFWTSDLLRTEFQTTEDESHRWRCALLLAQEDQAYQASLAEGLLGAHPLEVEVLLPLLRPFSEETEKTFVDAITTQDDAEVGIRAVCAMADSNLGEQFWEREGVRIITWLESVESGSDWARMMTPIASFIEEPLRESAQEGMRPSAVLLAEARAANLERLLEAFHECKPSDVPVYLKPLNQYPGMMERWKRTAADTNASSRHRANAMAALMSNGVFPKEVAVDDLDLNAKVIFRAESVEIDLLMNYLLEVQDDPVWQRVLILILWTKKKEFIASGTYDALGEHLKALYRSHPDCGVHGAARLVLKRWNEPLPEPAPPTDANWFVSEINGMTFAIATPHIPLGVGAEKFAVATTEISLGVAKRFGYKLGSEMDDETVSSSFNLFELMGFCNRLSRDEGLDECYEDFEAFQESVGKVVKTRAPKEDLLQLSGYRFPTTDEWIYLCNEGSDYRWVFGNESYEIAPYYCCFRPNAESIMNKVGSRFPSKLGIYDLQGSKAEALMDPYSLNREQPFSTESSNAFKAHTHARGGSSNDRDLSKMSTDSRTKDSVEEFEFFPYGTLRLVRSYFKK